MSTTSEDHGADTIVNQPLPRNVRLLGGASLLNDVASEMIFPLLPQFLMSVLGGNRFYLGVIEGVADSTASLRDFDSVSLKSPRYLTSAVPR